MAVNAWLLMVPTTCGATFAVINRELPVPQFTTREEGGYLYIETEALTLRYRIGAAINPALKSPSSLQVTLTVNGIETIWYPDSSCQR